MQTLLRNSLATARFEFRRSLTLQRMSVAIVMLGFAPSMSLILMLGGGDEFRQFVMLATLFMVCLLSLLLWATPNVHAELEGKSWTFVTSRPGGRLSILLGKFLTSACWAFAVCWIGMTLCLGEAMILVDPPGLLREWIVFTVLAALAATVYAAIFSFIGVVFHRRAMVFAAAYSLLVEFLLSILPANVSKITARYHLQGLALDWFGWFLPTNDPTQASQEWENLFGTYPPALHVAALLAITLLMLGGASLVIRFREYITADES